MVLPSLFIGSGALTNQQDAISVISNNIANVNTTAFKSSIVTFQERAGDLLSPASASTRTLGGTNPIGVGGGVVASAITTDFSQGSVKRTGVGSHLALQGDGFYVVSSESELGAGLVSPQYTRDGSFNFDADGTLVNSAGQKVFAATFYNNDHTVKTVPNYSSVTFYSDQTFGTTGLPNDAIGANPGPPVAGVDFMINNAGGGTPAAFDSSIISEMSVRGNLINPNTGVNIAAPGNITVAATPTNGELLITYDDLAGNTYSASMDADFNITDNIISYELVDDAGTGNSLQFRLRVEPGTATIESVFQSLDWDTTVPAGDSITFIGAAGTSQTETDITVSADDLEFLSLPSIQSLYDPITLPPLLHTMDPSVEVETANFTIEQDGTVLALGSQSEKMALGRLLIANFRNPDGLYNTGSNNYDESSNSGTAAISVIGGPNDPNAPSIAGTSMSAGAIEGSNVNIANEFADMIAYQRGLQASARSISTSDEILQTLLNL